MHFLLFLASNFFLFASSAAVPHRQWPFGNASVPFRTGLLFAQSIQKEGDQLIEQKAEEIVEEGDCQEALIKRIRAQIEEEGIELGGNLMAQILAGKRRQKVCGIFSAQSGALNECIVHSGGPSLHPLLLILQSICVQFAEALDAHGQCIAELQLARLEGQCAQACHRHISQSGTAGSQPKSGQSSGSAPSLSPDALLCQLALCSTNCFGAQLSECAEEGEPKGDPGVLKAMADQLAGLQMLTGMTEQAAGGQVVPPSDCAQLIGKAVSSASFVAAHDPAPSHQEQRAEE